MVMTVSRLAAGDGCGTVSPAADNVELGLPDHDDHESGDLVSVLIDSIHDPIGTWRDIRYQDPVGVRDPQPEEFDE